jgi:orotidine-5'-phosphate decarboxylase
MFYQAKVQLRNKLIVAVDVPTADAASQVAGKLRGHVGVFKVGLELFCTEGPGVVRNLAAGGDKVFLDLKFNDIPNTVRAAARGAAQLGVSMFTIHANGGVKMMEAALEGARAGAESVGIPWPMVLAVTVLTSLDGEDLGEIGLAGSPEEAVVRLARLAQGAGVDGIVASPREVTSLRKACGPQFVIVTPGIRPAQARESEDSPRAKPDDQARIATPFAAIQSGADYLVVGRPILQAPDPAAAADAIVREMEKAFESSVVV